eukprot:SAG31_NODE_22082_length_534_cov_1.064368_1_plen_68_part_01
MGPITSWNHAEEHYGGPACEYVTAKSANQNASRACITNAKQLDEWLDRAVEENVLMVCTPSVAPKMKR